MSKAWAAGRVTTAFGTHFKCISIAPLDLPTDRGTANGPTKFLSMAIFKSSFKLTFGSRFRPSITALYKVEPVSFRSFSDPKIQFWVLLPDKSVLQHLLPVNRRQIRHRIKLSNVGTTRSRPYAAAQSHPASSLSNPTCHRGALPSKTALVLSSGAQLRDCHLLPSPHARLAWHKIALKSTLLPPGK